MILEIFLGDFLDTKAFGCYTHCLHNFAKNFLQLFCTDGLKGNLHILSFSLIHIQGLKILQIFLHIEICLATGFSKMYILLYFEHLLVHICAKNLDFVINIQICSKCIKYYAIIGIWLIFYLFQEEALKHSYNGDQAVETVEKGREVFSPQGMNIQSIFQFLIIRYHHNFIPRPLSLPEKCIYSPIK